MLRAHSCNSYGSSSLIPSLPLGSTCTRPVDQRDSPSISLEPPQAAAALEMEMGRTGITPGQQQTTATTTTTTATRTRAAPPPTQGRNRRGAGQGFTPVQTLGSMDPMDDDVPQP